MVEDPERRGHDDGDRTLADGGTDRRQPADDEPDAEAAGFFAESASDDAGNATTLLGHFYRGEMDRVITWRERLDQATNWAVTIMAAILTWVFTSRDNPHYLLLIAMLTVLVFLAIDVRRYRAYDVWRSRVRIVEEDVLAPVVDPGTETEHERWREELARDLRRPAIKMPFSEAVGRRLRRIYLPLLAVLLAAWVARVTVYEPEESVAQTASVLSVPGTVVIGAVLVAFGALAAVAFWPRERQAKGELYERGMEGEWKDHKETDD